MEPNNNASLLEKLQLRMKEVEDDKETIQYKLNLLESKIKTAIATLPKRPNVDESKIEEQIRKLDFQRETRTMTLNEEKANLREQDAIRARARALREFRRAEEALSALRRERAALAEAREQRAAQAAELGAGLRRLELAARLGVPARELVAAEVPVPEEHAPRVLGRGRANLQAWGAACGAALEYARPRGVLLVQGTEAAVAAVRARVERITLEERAERAVSEAAFAALRLDRFALLNRLQDAHDARLDVERGSLTLKLSGTAAAVAAVRAALDALETQVATEEVAVPEAVLPAVLGKGGATIRALQEAHGVDVAIEREAGRALVRGRAAGVAAAAAALRGLVEGNQTVEEQVPLEGAYQISAVLGKGGATISGLQRGSGARFDLAKTDRDHGVLKISGPAAKVAAGLQLAREVLAALAARTAVVPAGEVGTLKALVGKGGAGIQALRAACDGAELDLDWEAPAVRVVGADAAHLARARALVEAEVEKNQHTTVLVGKGVALALKGGRGKACREAITQELGASLEVDGNGPDGRVKLRGSREQLAAALEKLEEFRANNHSEEVPVFPEDEASLVQGGQANALQQLQEETGAELRLLRQEHVVLVRGSPAEVAAGKAALHRMLHGDDAGGVVLLTVDRDALGPVIGKGGKTVKKFQEDHAIAIDILRARNQLRLRGEPENVQNAKDAITTFIAGLRITSVIRMSQGYKREYADTVVKEMGVQIEESGTDIKIRGLIQDVGDARARLAELVADAATLRVPVSEDQIKVLASTGETNFRAIKLEHNVGVELDVAGCAVVVRGRPDAAAAARAAVYQMLDIVFQGQFAEVLFPRAALRDVLTAAAAADVGRAHGVAVARDRRGASARVRGPAAAAVAAAAAALEALLGEWRRTHAVLAVRPEHQAALIGRGGREVNALQKATGATVDLDKAGGEVLISGAEDQVAAAREQLLAKIEKLEKENAQIQIDPEAVGTFIGKGGSNIRSIQEECGVNIDTARMSGVLRLRGPEEGLAKALERVRAFQREWEANNHAETVELEDQCARALIARQGGRIREVRGACPDGRVDVDADTGAVALRGPAAQVARAKALLAKFAEEWAAERRQQQQRRRRDDRPPREGGEGGGGRGPGGQKGGAAAAAAAAAAGTEEKAPVNNYPQIPLGADPDMIAELQGKKNRSSKRRSRKSKQAQGSTNNSGTATPTELHAQNGAAVPAAVAMNGHGGGGGVVPPPLPDQGSAEANNLLAMLLGGSAAEPVHPGAGAQDSTTTQNGEEQQLEDDYYVSSSGFTVRLS